MAGNIFIQTKQVTSSNFLTQLFNRIKQSRKRKQGLNWKIN